MLVAGRYSMLSVCPKVTACCAGILFETSEGYAAILSSDAGGVRSLCKDLMRCTPVFHVIWDVRTSQKATLNKQNVSIRSIPANTRKKDKES